MPASISLTAAIGSVTGVAIALAGNIASPQISDVLGIEALIMGAYGAMGGAAYGLASRKPLWASVRVVVLGALLAVGAGSQAPLVMSWWFPSLETYVADGVKALANFSFFVGLGQGWITARFIDGPPREVS